MKNGEDFRRAMGQADDDFVRVVNEALEDLRRAKRKRRPRRRTVHARRPSAPPMPKRRAQP